MTSTKVCETETAWEHAQESEQEFWVHLVQDELQIETRDQLVGVRLCEGRVHLGTFGYPWEDFMYEGTRRSHGKIKRIGPVIEGKMLDVGSSLISVFEKARSLSVVAIDPTLEGLSRKLPGIAVLGKVHNAEYRSCRVEDVPETDFDIVWCNNVLDHADDWKGMIRNFARVLKSGGKLLLGADVRKQDGLLTHSHISQFDEKDLLEAVKEAGFDIEWNMPVQQAPQYRFTLRAVKR